VGYTDRQQSDLISLLTEIRRVGYTDRQQGDIISLEGLKIRGDTYRWTDTVGHTRQTARGFITLILFD
jgi:hypothetical protein